MAQFSDLAADQQAEFLAADSLLRASLVKAARALHELTLVQAQCQAGADALVASLDAGAALPNASGLGGAQPVVKEQWQGIRADMDAILADHWQPATSKPLYAKFCGAVNILSS